MIDATPRPVGPIERFLTIDHARLDALLERADRGDTIDTAAYDQFRGGLLRHIAMEEKVLLRFAADRRGAPLPIATALRRDHGEIAKLLVPAPTHAICDALRQALAAHNAIEEGSGGLYATCDAIAGVEADAVVERLRAQPAVPVAKHYDGPLLSIAQKRKAPTTDPVTLLLECHGRIRTFVTMASRIASAPSSPPEEIAEAVARVRRYFADALPLHEADEEKSLAPRLLRSKAPAEIADALVMMASQHTAIHALLTDLDAAWYWIGTHPDQISAIAPTIAMQQRALEQIFEVHLTLEETIIFPAIPRLLGAGDLDALYAEIRGRRTPELMARAH